MSYIESALAGSDAIDANWLTGADKFIMFGAAGSLDSDATTGKFVIPTENYREEGFSYHYASPADYIKIKNSDMVKSIFDELKLPSVQGKVWTTDDKNGYPPQYSPEVFKKVMEQVENFEEYSGETVEKGNDASAKVYQYEMPEGNVMMVAEKATPYGKL